MRITRKYLEQLAIDYAEEHGKEYGRKPGAINLTDTDARVAPYNYRLVQYRERGGYTPLTEALTARQMYDFLKVGLGKW